MSFLCIIISLLFSEYFGTFAPRLQWIALIIRWIFFPFFIGWEPTTWPANNCLQIMVCSCVIPSKSVFAANNILLMRNSNHALVVALAWLRRKPTDFCQRRAYRLPQKFKNKLGDRMIKQLLELGYLVNKPLQAAGLSADNVRGWEIVRKMNIWPRSEASGAGAKFWGQSLSQGHYQQTYQQARKGFIYFITLRLIFIRFNTHGWQFCPAPCFQVRLEFFSLSSWSPCLICTRTVGFFYS